MTCCFVWVGFLLLTCFTSRGSRAFGCDYSISPNTFNFRGHPIAYEVAQTKPFIESLSSVDESSREVNTAFSSAPRGGSSVKSNDREIDIYAVKEEDPILLLNGFGVGSFHQHRLIPHLLCNQNVGSRGNSIKRSIYCMDYLGQGKSWPSDCDDGFGQTEQGLRYCIYTWSDQIIHFIQDVILPNHPKAQKVHLCGNSVGGHLSVVVAFQRPDLISTITLLNATPVWGLNLPFWSGHLPPPGVPRWIGRKLFDWIRDENTISKYLEVAYSRREAFDENLVKEIRQCTELSKGGHAAFSSILWSPPAKFPDLGATDFGAMLESLECDVLILFGRDDPWCTPAFGRRMARKLASRLSAPQASSQEAECNQDKKFVHRYVELDNVGHCPNHEAPQAVAKVLGRWVAASSDSQNSRSKAYLKLVHDEEDAVTIEPWGEVIIHEIEEAEVLAEQSFIDKMLTRMVG